MAVLSGLLSGFFIGVTADVKLCDRFYLFC